MKPESYMPWITAASDIIAALGCWIGAGYAHAAAEEFHMRSLEHPADIRLRERERRAGNWLAILILVGMLEAAKGLSELPG